jgi:hypothetical protein
MAEHEVAKAAPAVTPAGPADEPSHRSRAARSAFGRRAREGWATTAEPSANAGCQPALHAPSAVSMKSLVTA